LYHSGNIKLATSSGGVTVTGSVSCDGVTLGDNELIQLGNSSDLRIYHDSGSNYVGSYTNQSFAVFTNNTTRWIFDNGGALYPAADNSYDIGLSNYRVKNIYSQDLNVIKASGNLSGTFVASNGLGTLEIGGSTGAFIDLKTPSSDDFDFRLGTSGSGGYLTVPSSQSISVQGHLNPSANDTYDLGTSSVRWRNLYTTDLQLSNEGKTNDVDGTWGNYTIQEGESDLFLINNRSGKKYKFNLTEVS